MSWNLPKPLKQEVRVRISVKGFTSNRDDISKLVKEKFQDYIFIEDEGPILDELYQNDDQERAFITQEVKNWIEELNWNTSNLEPTKSDILFEAMKIIYKD